MVDIYTTTSGTGVFRIVGDYEFALVLEERVDASSELRQWSDRIRAALDRMERLDLLPEEALDRLSQAAALVEPASQAQATSAPASRGPSGDPNARFRLGDLVQAGWTAAEAAAIWVGLRPSVEQAVRRFRDRVRRRGESPSANLKITYESASGPPRGVIVVRFDDSQTDDEIVESVRAALDQQTVDLSETDDGSVDDVG